MFFKTWTLAFVWLVIPSLPLFFNYQNWVKQMYYKSRAVTWGSPSSTNQPFQTLLSYLHIKIFKVSIVSYALLFHYITGLWKPFDRCTNLYPMDTSLVCNHQTRFKKIYKIIGIAWGSPSSTNKSSQTQITTLKCPNFI